MGDAREEEEITKVNPTAYKSEGKSQINLSPRPITDISNVLMLKSKRSSHCKMNIGQNLCLVISNVLIEKGKRSSD